METTQFENQLLGFILNFFNIENKPTEAQKDLEEILKKIQSNITENNHFFSPENTIFFQAIWEIKENLNNIENSSINSFSVAQILHQKNKAKFPTDQTFEQLELLSSLIPEFTSYEAAKSYIFHNLEIFTQNKKEELEKQEFQQLLNKNAKSLKSNTKTIQDAYQEIQEYTQQNKNSSSSFDLKGAEIGSLVREYYKTARDVAEGKISFNRLQTGYACLDQAIAGFNKGQMITFGGRPGTGKSAFMINIAHNLAKQDKKIYIISLEMTAADIMKRLISLMCKITFNKVDDYKLTENNYSNLYKVLNEYNEKYLQNIVIFDINYTPTIDIKGPLNDLKTIQKIIQKLAESKEKPDLIMIDHLLLINDSSMTKNSTRENLVGNISTEIKSLTLKYNMPIFVVTQLNREYEKRASPEPISIDLRDSGRIEQDSDIILVLYEERSVTSLLSDSNPPAEEKPLLIKVVKHRFRTADVKINFIFKGQYMTFEEDDSANKNAYNNNTNNYVNREPSKYTANPNTTYDLMQDK